MSPFDTARVDSFISAVINIYHFQKLSEFLKQELERRKVQNPAYSLRAFARDLGVSASRLSEIIQKDEGMNPATAEKIATALQLSFNEIQYFELLITVSSSRPETARQLAKKKLAEFRKQKKQAIEKSGFENLLSRWYYIPLIELVTLNNPRSHQAIAETLGISSEEVTEALTQLETAGYIGLDTNNKWKKTTPFLQIESSKPSTAIKEYHKKLIANGSDALIQPIKNRKILSTVLGIRKSSIEAARQDIEKFNRDFIAKYASENSAETVYGMNVQFFEFDKTEKAGP